MTETMKRQTLLRKLMQIVIPLTISIGLCWLLFTGIDFGEMLAIIRYQCDFRWILLCLAIATLSHLLRAFRWGIQLRALGIRPPLRALVYSIFGTYAVNLVLPRLGEVWRTGYIAHRQSASFSSVFGSMLADRLADTVTVLIFIVITFFAAGTKLAGYIEANGETYRAALAVLSSPWLWLTIVLLCAAAYAIYAMLARRSGNSLATKIKSAVKGLWQGFSVIARMPHKGLWLALSAGIWGCYFIQMYVCFFAFPFTEEILHTHGAVAVLLTFTLSSISMGVPSNGGIGPWQWAVIFALGIYGTDMAPAGAFANLVMGCNTLLLTALGLLTFIGIAADKKNLNKNEI